MLMGIILALLALAGDTELTNNLLIKIDDTIISQGGQDIVTIVAINNSDSRIAIDGIGHLELSGNSGPYWAPFVIKTGNHAEANEIAPAIGIRPKTSVRFTVDMSDIK
jgi:hypothetical protein